jgi:hypothetical protein
VVVNVELGAIATWRPSVSGWDRCDKAAGEIGR